MFMYALKNMLRKTLLYIVRFMLFVFESKKERLAKDELKKEEERKKEWNEYCVLERKLEVEKYIYIKEMNKMSTKEKKEFKLKNDDYMNKMNELNLKVEKLRKKFKKERIERDDKIFKNTVGLKPQKLPKGYKRPKVLNRTIKPLKNKPRPKGKFPKIDSAFVEGCRPN